MKTRVFDLILFDLGNTLIYFNGDEDQTAAVATLEMTRNLISQGYDLDDKQFPKAFHTSMRSYFEKREKDCLELTSAYVLREQLMASGFSNPPTEHLHSALKAMYAVTESHWKLGDDTIATLDRLKIAGYRLGIISNAADGGDVHRLVDAHKLRSYFEIILISAEVGIRKPHPLIFNLALDFFQVPPWRAVMVGDLPEIDVLGAQKVGITGVWITRWLHPDLDEGSRAGIKPDAEIVKLSMLPQILTGWDVRNFPHFSPGVMIG